VPIDFISPDFIGSEKKLTTDDCKNGIEYLSRMSCIDVQSETIRLDPIVKAILP